MPPTPTRNLVICCDGTGNEYGDRNTNVVKLFELLPKYDERQLTYYDPGVGTFSLPGVVTEPLRFVSRVMGLAFGTGFTSNLEDAYEFLMDHYEDGDRIYLIGFSRGAFLVRALAGMLHKVGLLTRGSSNLIPYASKMYKNPRNKAIAAGFKRTYSRDVPIHFVGIWDTVKSLGNIYDPLSLQYTHHNPSVRNVRHAVSIDERRCFYRPNLWGTLPEQDVKEVWFAGVHSDVGGSYSEAESGLSKIALRWMVREALDFGLLIEPANVERLLPETSTADQSAPDPRAKLHRSLAGAWWIVEFLPKVYEDMREDPPRRKLKIPAGEWRHLPVRPRIHASVDARRAALASYRPPNLPSAFELEHDRPWPWSAAERAGQ